MTTKRIYGVILAVVCWLAIFAGSTMAEPVTITVWDAIPATGRDTFLAIIDDFRAKHPDIKVNVEYVAAGYQAIREKLTVALAANVAPNVVHLAHVHAYSFRYMGIFMPLNDYIAKDPSFGLNDWYPPFLETVSLDGEIYGSPYNLSTPLTYYSPDLLKESGLEPRPPATWDEMIKLGRRITRDTTGDGKPDIWATDNVQSPGWVMEAFLGQAGGTTMNADRTELRLNSPEALKSWQFQQDLIHKEPISRYPGAPAADLAAGKVGWWIRSTASLRSRLESNSAAGTAVDVAPLACDVRCYAPIGGGAFYAVDKGSQAERDATYKFLSFLVEPDNLARYSGGSGYMAGRKSAMSSKYLRSVFEEHRAFRVTYEQLAVAHPETQAPEWGQIQALWEHKADFLDHMFKNGEPVKPLLDDLTRRGNIILKEFYQRFPKKAVK